MLPKEKWLNTKDQLKEWLRIELRPYPRGLQGLLPTEGAILKRHQVLLRKTEYYTNSGKKLLAAFYKLRLRRLQCRHALHIPLNVCAKGMRIMHLGPVLINGNASIGEFCSLHINTSIVAGGLDSSAPVLGDRVIVGVGAVVLGGVRVADYTAIGANAVVNKDITEENTAVAGVPAKKISNNGSRAWNQQSKENG